MSGDWTRTLAPPLRKLAGLGRWQRIERPRRGTGWLFQQSGTGAGPDWHYAERDSDPPVPLTPLEDPGLTQLPQICSGWRDNGDSVRLLAWRPGSRAVFRVRSKKGPRICKIYRKDRELLRRWTSLDSSSTRGWSVPKVLGWDADLRWLTLEFCGGDSLHRRWSAGRGSGTDGERIADLLRWIADRPIPPGLPWHGVQQEAQLLFDRFALFQTVLERPPRSARRVAVAVVESLFGGSPHRPVLCHRDLHDKQILLQNARGTLIDLDLVAAGHPALDVGNILAHLHLRTLQGVDLPWDEIAAGISERAIPERRIVRSLHAWTAAALLRLALIYSQRRRREGLLEDLLESADQALNRRGVWRGIV